MHIKIRSLKTKDKRNWNRAEGADKIYIQRNSDNHDV